MRESRVLILRWTVEITGSVRHIARENSTWYWCPVNIKSGQQFVDPRIAWRLEFCGNSLLVLTSPICMIVLHFFTNGEQVASLFIKLWNVLCSCNPCLHDLSICNHQGIWDTTIGQLEKKTQVVDCLSCLPLP